MKKLVTVFALALITSGAFAQFNQGRWLAGGNVGFSSETIKGKSNGATTTFGKQTSIGFTPKVGYFVIDNLAVGAGLNVTSQSFKGEGNNASKETNTKFTVNPFVRYYLDPGIFFHGEIGVGSQSNKDKATGSNTTVTTKYGALDWGLGVGYAYFLNDFVAIEPMVSYQSSSIKNNDNDAKQISSGIFLNVGLQVYLGARN